MQKYSAVENKNMSYGKSVVIQDTVKMEFRVQFKKGLKNLWYGMKEQVYAKRRKDEVDRDY